MVTRSRASSHKSSKVSSRSSASAAATKARTQAEAAKLKVSYAEKEAAMMKEKAMIEARQQRDSAEAERQKAELEANLHVLKQQKEAEAAFKEAAIFEAAVSDLDEGCFSELRDLTLEDPATCTTEYVERHSSPQHAQQLLEDVTAQQPTAHPTAPANLQQHSEPSISTT